MPATKSPKQDVVPVRITPAMRSQLEELITLGFGNQADVIRIAVDRMHNREMEDRKPFIIFVDYGHNYVVLDDNLKRFATVDEVRHACHIAAANGAEKITVRNRGAFFDAWYSDTGWIDHRIESTD